MSIVTVIAWSAEQNERTKRGVSRQLFNAPSVATARTCEELRENGVTSSGTYYVDPDGAGVGDPPIKVECTMADTQGTFCIKIYKCRTEHGTVTAD